MAAQIYEIVYKKSVGKDLRKLPQAARTVIVKKILALAANPFPAASTKLRGTTSLYRLRHATYRIVYQVKDSELIVVVIKVGHRSKVYRDF